MRTTNYLQLSALVLGSVIAGCSSNNGSGSTLPGSVGGNNASNTGGATSTNNPSAGGSHTGGVANNSAGGNGNNPTGGNGNNPTGGNGNIQTGGNGNNPTGGNGNNPTGGNGNNPTGGNGNNPTGGNGNNPAGGRTGTGGSTGNNPTGGAPTTTGGATGNTTTGGSSSGVGGAATGGTPGGGSGNCTPGAKVLSDFESGKGSLYPVPTSNTTGFWYVYKDTTNCTSATQVPASVTDAAVAATALPSGDSRASNCNKYAMHSSISNCATYSGFGAALHPTPGSTSQRCGRHQWV